MFICQAFSSNNRIEDLILDNKLITDNELTSEDINRLSNFINTVFICCLRITIIICRYIIYYPFIAENCPLWRKCIVLNY